MLHDRTVKIATATVLWTTAVAFAILGTVSGELRLMFWSVFVALAACMLTGHIVAECAVRKERLRMEHLIDGMIARAAERKDGEVHSIR